MKIPLSVLIEIFSIFDSHISLSRLVEEVEVSKETAKALRAVAAEHLEGFEKEFVLSELGEYDGGNVRATSE